MHQGRIVFSQLMDFLPKHEFKKCVQRYRGSYRVRSFSCWDQFLSMAFAQLTYRESLRDIETCLAAMRSKLYHIGIRGNVCRSTLADANEKRDWRIYAEFAHGLIRQARTLYARDSLGLELEQTAYVLDSTTIDLCLSLFPGPDSASARAPSNCIPFWTCMAVFPVLSSLQTERRTT